MKIEKKQNSLKHYSIIFHNCAAFRLSVIRGLIKYFWEHSSFSEKSSDFLAVSWAQEWEADVGKTIAYVF